ncbi:MAG: fibronectin type III domain-containing protein, partial [Candidatus Nanopelagicales bacterium]
MTRVASASRLLAEPTATASAEPAPSAEPDVPTTTERSNNATRNGTQGMRVAWQTAATYASAPANESVGLNTVTVKPTSVINGQQAVGPLAYGTTGASGFTFGGRSIPANSIWVARLNTSTEPPSVTSMIQFPRGAAGVRIVDVAETVFRDGIGGFRASLNRVWMLLSLNGEAWAANGGVLSGADPNMSSRAYVAAVDVDGPSGALSTGLSVRGSTRGLNCGAVRAPCASAQPRSLSAYVPSRGDSAGVNVLIQGSGNFTLFDRQVSGGRGKAMEGSVRVNVQGAWSSAVSPATANPSSVNALESFPLTDTLIASNYSGSLTFDERTVRARGQAGRGAALVFFDGGTGIDDPRRYAVRNIESTGLVTITAATGSVDMSAVPPRHSGVVAGYFSGTMTLGGTTLTAGQGRTAPFIAKVEETRTGFDWAWAAQGRDVGAGGGVINAVAETPNGVRIAGTMWGTVDFGPHRVTGPWAQTDPQALFAADYVPGSGWTWAVGSEGQTGSIRPTSLLVLGSGAGAVSGIYGGISGTATVEGATIGSLSGCRAGEPVLAGVDNCASVPFGVGIGVDTARPTPPNNVAASGVNEGVYVQWEPPVNDGGSAIASYTATVRNFNDAVAGTCTVQADAVDYSCTIGGLIEVPYRVSVTATNTAGRTSPQSAAIAFVPLSQTPSAPRDVLVIIEVFTGTFQVSWGAPADNGGSAITSYTATARAADGSTRTCTTSANRCNIDGLTLGETYSVTVTATNSAGRTSPASPAQVVAAEAL